MKSIAFLMASAAMVVGAQAASLSFNFSNPLQTTEISQSGSLGLFDTALGTLTGVSLSFTGSNTTQISLTNNAAQTQNVRATSVTELYFSSSLIGLDNLIVASNPVITLTATTGLQTLVPRVPAAFGPFPGAQTITWTNELTSLLGEFAVAGGGSFLLSCESLSGLTVSGGGGNVVSSQNTQANCGGAITYTYDAVPPSDVPEPASLALVGLALAGVALSRRKTKA